MGIVAVIVLGIVGLLGAAFSKILAEEFKAWAPSIAAWLLRAAILRLPLSDQDRYTEEWAAHLSDTPGDIGKILTAAGFNLAALKMSGNSKYPHLTVWRLLPKRAFDILVSLEALIILSPFFLVVALAIKLESDGPVLVRLRYLGRNRKIIHVYQFRVTTWSAEGAREMTKIGNILWRTNLAELPVLFSILKGDMSMVGPRYHAPDMTAAGQPYELLVPNYHERHTMRPGLTGLAQVRGLRGPTNNAEAAKLRIVADIEYLRNYSFGLDLRILMTTLWREIAG